MTEYARVTYPEYRVAIAPMIRQDVPAVARLYEDARITSQNYKERLSEHSETSFKNIGGMFRIHDEERLAEMLNNPVDLATVVRNYNGGVSAFLWNNLAPSDEPDIDGITYYDNTKHLESDIRNAQKKGALSLGGDIVVAQGNAYPYISLLMFYVQLKLLQDMGIKIMLGEVYRVTGYGNGGEAFTTNLLNERSISLMERTGAVRLGQAAEKRIILDGFWVTVRPESVFWDIGKARKALKQKTKDKVCIYDSIG